MSISEDAQLLISHANVYIQDATSYTNVANDSMGRAIEVLGQLRTITGDSTSKVYGILGEGHPSAGPIAGIAQSVDSKANDIQLAISNVIGMALELDQLTNTYASTMGTVGRILLGNG